MSSDLVCFCLGPQGSWRVPGRTSQSEAHWEVRALPGPGLLKIGKRWEHGPSKQQSTKHSHCFLLIWLLLVLILSPGAAPSVEGPPSMDPPLTDVPSEDPGRFIPHQTASWRLFTTTSCKSYLSPTELSRPSPPENFIGISIVLNVHGEGCLSRHFHSRDLRHIPKGI